MSHSTDFVLAITRYEEGAKCHDGSVLVSERCLILNTAGKTVKADTYRSLPDSRAQEGGCHNHGLPRKERQTLLVIFLV